MIRATRRDAVKLMLDGQKVLARMEMNGVKVDEAYLDKQLKATGDRIAELEAAMQKEVVWTEMKKRFGAKANLDSPQQVGKTLFGPLGIQPDPDKVTASGLPSMTEEALSNIDLPFMTLYRERKKIVKLRGTYLLGVKREVNAGFVHPSYNLAGSSRNEETGGAISYRSSCQDPNFQNIPVRNKKLAAFIRQAYMARSEHHHMCDVDYSGIETKVASAYHFDPEWMRYMFDSSADMHRDMAMKCYKLTAAELGPIDSGTPGKDVRYCAKNMFVFPQFYGSYYLLNAKDLWAAIDKLKLRTAQGVPMKEHLAKKGIKALGACAKNRDPVAGTFEYHLRQVENWYWNEKYPVFSKWKKDLYAKYLKTATVDMHTGFQAKGSYRRNQVLNLPIQGPAFHCLLLATILIQQELDRKKMIRSFLVGSVHDALVGDVHDAELEDYLRICKRVMTKDVPAIWKWINVPLAVEAEVAPAGRSWHEKTNMEIAA